MLPHRNDWPVVSRRHRPPVGIDQARCRGHAGSKRRGRIATGREAELQRQLNLPWRQLHVARFQTSSLAAQSAQVKLRGEVLGKTKAKIHCKPVECTRVEHRPFAHKQMITTQNRGNRASVNRLMMNELVRPGGFEPPTFCSGGNEIKRNLLILRPLTTRLSRAPDGFSEKLRGKLLGKFLAWFKQRCGTVIAYEGRDQTADW